MSTSVVTGDADVAAVAALFADRSRSRVLMALVDGRSLPASVLAAEAGVSPQAMSAHLAKLLAEGLITVERSGRHRFYALAGARVATAIEALAAIAPTRPVTSLREGTRAQRLRAARTCYDHLAGALGVAITQALADHGALIAIDGQAATERRALDRLSAPVREHPYALGPHAETVLNRLGVGLTALRDARRPLLSFCLDWTEQRHHLAGALGAALNDAYLDNGWIIRGQRSREIRLTGAGAAALRERLRLEIEPTA
jgi:DNA-binding transcriptional ArsR family regulator